jgi:hypothetical protein
VTTAIVISELEDNWRKMNIPLYPILSSTLI